MRRLYDKKELLIKNCFLCGSYIMKPDFKLNGATRINGQRATVKCTQCNCFSFDEYHVNDKVTEIKQFLIKSESQDIVLSKVYGTKDSIGWAFSNKLKGDLKYSKGVSIDISTEDLITILRSDDVMNNIQNLLILQ